MVKVFNVNQCHTCLQSVIHSSQYPKLNLPLHPYVYVTFYYPCYILHLQDSGHSGLLIPPLATQ